MDTNTGEATISLRGFFTTQRHLQGQTLREIEKRLGFHEGRLSRGAKFYTPVMLPNTDNFHIAGYSQVAGHHTAEQYGADLNEPRDRLAEDAYKIQKRNVLSGWRLYGSDRLIKVLPVIRHQDGMPDDFQYPPGTGIPQWRIINEMSCRVICFVRDLDARFIPDQGFTEVRYK